MRERWSRIVHKALAVVRPQFRLRFADGIHGRLDLGRAGTTPHASRLCTAPARHPHAITRALRMSSGIGRRQ